MQSHLWTSFDPKTRLDLVSEAQTLVSQFDLKEINCEEEGGIEKVRDLQQFLSRKPLESDYNLGLLIEAHYLTPEAQNALLKTLEEPPTFSKLILIAKSPDHLLETVVSRCELREINTELSAQTDTDWEKIRSLLQASDGQRLVIAEGIDLQDWLAAWQHVLHQKLGVSNKEVDLVEKLSIFQIQRYLKVLLRLQKLQEDHVNTKLLASVMALNAPKLAS
jgi:hypothetical protein